MISRSFISMSLLMLLLASCSTKKYSPQLSSVNPSQAPIGAELTLSGSQFGDSPSVTIGTTSVTTKTRSDNSITLTLPRLPLGPTTVQVQNSDGTSEPKPFTVLQPVSVLSSFSPASGLVGTTVTIQGTNLQDVTEVRFSGGVSSAAQFQVSGNTIQAVVPSNTVTGAICLINNGGRSCSEQFFTIDVPPVITSISPDKGVSGTEITITGTNFQNVQEVSLGGQPITVKRGGTPTTLTIDAPSFSNIQTVSILVRTSAGRSNEGRFTGAPAPVIDKSRSIPGGLIPGSALTLKGSNFGDVTQVRFASGSVGREQFIRIAADQLTVKVPANTPSGQVQLINPYGTGPGVWFDQVTSGSGLTTDNLATNVGALTTGVISDGCDPTAFFYCITDREYEVGFKAYSQRCNTTYYKTEQLASSTYETYTGYRTTTGASYPTTGDILKLERNNQNTAYTGLAILTTTLSSGLTITYIGNITQNGTILAYSVTDGAVIKLCRKAIKSFSYPTATICSDCR